MEQEIARLRAEAAEHRRAAAQLRNSTLFTLNVPPPPSIAPKEILVAPTPAIAIDQTGSTQVRVITAAPRTRTPVIPKPFVGMEDHVVASRVRARLADEKARAADREVASRLLARLREDAAESKKPVAPPEPLAWGSMLSSRLHPSERNAPSSQPSDSVDVPSAIQSGKMETDRGPEGKRRDGRTSDREEFVRRLRAARALPSSPSPSSSPLSSPPPSPPAPVKEDSVLWQPPPLSEYLSSLEARVAEGAAKRRSILPGKQRTQNAGAIHHIGNGNDRPLLARPVSPVAPIPPGMAARAAGLRARRDAAEEERWERGREELFRRADQARASVSPTNDVAHVRDTTTSVTTGSRVVVDADTSSGAELAAAPTRAFVPLVPIPPVPRPVITVRVSRSRSGGRGRPAGVSGQSCERTVRVSGQSSGGGVSGQSERVAGQSSSRRGSVSSGGYVPPPTPPGVRAMRERAAKGKERREERERRRREAVEAAEAEKEAAAREAEAAAKRAKAEAAAARRAQAAERERISRCSMMAVSHYQVTLIRRAWDCWSVLPSSARQLSLLAEQHHRTQVLRYCVDAWMIAARYYSHRRSRLHDLLASLSARRCVTTWRRISRATSTLARFGGAVKKAQLRARFLQWNRLTLRRREIERQRQVEIRKQRLQEALELHQRDTADRHCRRHRISTCFFAWKRQRMELRLEKDRLKWEADKLAQVMQWLDPL